MAIANQADVTKLRQQIKKARDHIQAEEWHKARATLNGLDHPMADRLRAEVTIHFASQPPRTLPFLPLIVAFGVEILFLIGLSYGAWRWTASPPSEVFILPTLASLPYADCTPAEVDAWWAEQHDALDSFLQDASSASRTLPSEALTQRLAHLHQVRADFSSIPPCASMDTRQQVSEVWRTMDDILLALEAWSLGTLDELGVQAVIRGASTVISS